MNKAFSLIEVVVVLMIAALLGVLAYTGVEYIGGEWGPWREAKIIHREYTPRQSSTNTGVDSSGKTITTTGSTSEKYTLIAKTQGRTFSAKVDAEVWSACPVGSTVTARPKLGYLSKSPVAWEVLPILE